VDSTPDTEPDPEPDTSPDVEPDAPADVPTDWPTDIPTDWPHETSTACEAAGGFCMPDMWDMCPPGFEPTAPDDVMDCGGRCCIVAVYSECSAMAGMNCIGAEACEGCWGDPDGTFACEEGRTCCVWYCE
jgi:hypothetical protein